MGSKPQQAGPLNLHQRKKQIFLIWQRKKSREENVGCPSHTLSYTSVPGVRLLLGHQVYPPGMEGSSWPWQRDEAVRVSPHFKVIPRMPARNQTPQSP